MWTVIWWLHILWLKLRGIQAACRAARTCRRRLRLKILRAFGAQIGEGTRIEGPFTLMNVADDLSTLRIGSGCYIGPDTILDLTAPVTIGDRVTISMRATLITHMTVGKSALAARYPSQKGPLEIADDCYLAAGVTLLHGIVVGPRALVAAGSIVRDSVPPDKLAAGVPAVIKSDLSEREPAR